MILSPLIPAKAGIQGRKQCRLFARQKLGPLFRPDERRARSRAELISRAETAGDFVVARKPARRFLGERESAVDLDFENAAARSAKRYLRRGLPFEQQIPRRTGARLIASLAAVFDLDLHRTDLAMALLQFIIAKSHYGR